LAIRITIYFSSGVFYMTIDEMYTYLLLDGYEALVLDSLSDKELEDLYDEVVEDD
jgi:hypothetical protein